MSKNPFQLIGIPALLCKPDKLPKLVLCICGHCRALLHCGSLALFRHAQMVRVTIPHRHAFLIGSLSRSAGLAPQPREHGVMKSNAFGLPQTVAHRACEIVLLDHSGETVRLKAVVRL